jgi:hypothetical protein
LELAAAAGPIRMALTAAAAVRLIKWADSPEGLAAQVVLAVVAS